MSDEQGCLFLPADLKSWPTPKNVAEQIGVNATTVIRLIDQGELEAFDLSSGTRHRRFRINPQSLTNLIRRRYFPENRLNHAKRAQPAERA